MTLHDELTIGPLAAELAPLIADGNDGAILAVLNRKDIPAKGKVSAHDIQQYLFVAKVLLTIESTNTPSCAAAKRALELFPIFDLSYPEILESFIEVLTGLENDHLVPAFTAEHKAHLLSLGDVLISRAEQLGITPTIEQIAQALRG